MDRGAHAIASILHMKGKETAMRLLRCFAVTIISFSALACATRLNVLGPGKTPAPTVKLTAGPLVLRASTLNPPTLFLSLRAHNVNEEFWCPGVRWTWPDGTVSEDEGDCDPYDPSDSYQRKWSINKEILVRSFFGGPRTLKVELVKAGRVIWFDTVTVHIAGATN